ncbi:MAG: Holliday junction branch migration protein RuvA [Actinomycetota bacterium]|nr:Holliday junction branch migration protein RuvA [Actinomycetota bacterium]
MIGSLRGEVLDKDPAGEAVIEVGGVGYRVTINPSTLVAMADVGDVGFVHVHHHIRDDHQQLYGFPTADERRCFEILISAHGVGPALAMAVLATHPPLSLRQAVATDDVNALCLVPGVGKKTAQRLVLELKAKLEVPDLGGRPAPADGPGTAAPSALVDVRDALSAMGFSGDEIAHGVAELSGDDTSALLRQALQRLAAR